MRIRLLETQLGLRNSTARLPFKYGSACLTRCPQAVLQATIETGAGTGRGYGGDCLPPGWFDKSPEKDYRAQIDDMLSTIATAQQAFEGMLSSESEFFAAWLTASEKVHRWAADEGLTPLLASFGVSLVERAILDAACRIYGVSFATAVRDNLFAIFPGEIHEELAGYEMQQWLPPEPETAIFVRHTIGLADPLTTAEIPAGEKLHDSLPQSLEEYLQSSGIRYLKVKVSNRLDHDLARLTAIAELVQRYRGEDYFLTLDGNEQYHDVTELDTLIEAMRSKPELSALLDHTLAIEQPLERRVALDEAHIDGVAELSSFKPVIIDESDGTLDTFHRALELGYRGVSSKNCKGPIKSLINAGLTWLRNDRGAQDHYLMTGEDLCSVGIVPVQADLCLAATLGLTHVERNGHHYHPGLSYLPPQQQAAALEAHGDFYARVVSGSRQIITPHLNEGRFQIASLHCPGFGFAVEPDLRDYQAPGDWEFASLGLET